MPLKPIVLCEGDHDRCLIEDVLRKKFKIVRIVIAKSIEEVYKFSRRKRGEFIVYVVGGKPRIYRALNILSSQLLRNRFLKTLCVVIDENLERPMERIPELLRNYLASRFAKEAIEMVKDKHSFTLSYRGFGLRIWVITIPKSLEKQVEAVVGSREINYCKLDYSKLFGDRGWFKELVEALNSTIRG